MIRRNITPARPTPRVNPEKYAPRPRPLTRQQKLGNFLDELKFVETPESKDMEDFKKNQQQIRPVYDHNNDNVNADLQGNPQKNKKG